jgi:hypothetical protein
VLPWEWADYDIYFGFSLTVEDIDPAYTLSDLAAKLGQICAAMQEERPYDRNLDQVSPTRWAWSGSLPTTRTGDLSREALRQAETLDVSGPPVSRRSTEATP